MYYSDINSLKSFVTLTNKKRHLDVRCFSNFKFAVFFVLPNFKPKEFLAFINNLKTYNLFFVKKPTFSALINSNLLFVAYSKTIQNLLWYINKLPFSQGNRMVIPFLQINKNACAHTFVVNHLGVSSLAQSQGLFLNFISFLSYNNYNNIFFKNAHASAIIKVLKEKKDTNK